MRYLLNALYLCLLLAVSPVLLYAAIRHGKYREGIAEKLWGRASNLPSVSNRFWFHAVSVGEVNLLAGTLDRLSAEQPDVDIVISTTTKTGYGLAKRKYPDRTIFYCPLDFSWAVRNALRRVKPTALILVELELWPNLLTAAGSNDIPIAIINGRLSDRSTRGYRRLGRLMRKWMSNITLVTAQSDACAARFVEIGVAPERVHAVGSMKFDGAKTDRNNAQTLELRQLFNVRPEHIVFVAGSTQAPEEAMALNVFQRLAGEYPQLRLILVPRHPERGNEVAALLNQADVSWLRRSGITGAVSDNIVSPAPRVLLVDTVGELGGWWGCAQMGFVGGSMGKRGGQNMIEPSAFGVATCFGPNTKNFRDIVEQLLRSNAATVVEDEAALYTFIKQCVVDEAFRLDMGNRARQLVSSQRGATEKTVKCLTDLISKCVAFQQRTTDSTNHPASLPQPNEPTIPVRRRA